MISIRQFDDDLMGVPERRGLGLEAVHEGGHWFQVVGRLLDQGHHRSVGGRRRSVPA